MTEIVVQEQWLECAICMEQLDESCKMLPCQHTYCKACLERMYEHESSLICPQCRKTVPNSNGVSPIDDLPTNLVLLSLIEQVKRNPPRRPQNENDDLQAAIMHSIEDFHKEKHTDALLKHNEQLQTQLAMESSKRDVLLKSAQDMSEEFNELFLSQRSLDEELFQRENQNLLSEKEKLETEMAILKSEQENPSYLTDLISWFETNCTQFNRELKSEAQNAMKNLRRAKVTQQNDSIQRRLRTLLENLNIKEKSDPRGKTAENVSGNDDIVDELNKKLNEVKILLRNESQSLKSYSKSDKNYLSQPHPLPQSHPSYLSHSPQYQHSFQPNYYPPPIPLMSIPGGHNQMMPNMYSPPYYAPLPRMPHYYPPNFNYPPTPSHSSYLPSTAVGNPRSNCSEGSVRGFRGKRGRGGHQERFSSDVKNLNQFNSSKIERSGDHSKSLILPDVRDYDRFQNKIDKLTPHKIGASEKLHDKKFNEKGPQLPTASSGEGGGALLMLPDVRHYETVYSKFSQFQRVSSFPDKTSDTESFGAIHHGSGKKKSVDDINKFVRGKSYRGRSKDRYRNTSKKTDGFESDASADSTTSVSSKLSTCSVPAAFHEKKYYSSSRGKHRVRPSRNSREFTSKSTNSVKDKRNENDTETDGLKQLLFPSKEEACKRNLDVKKRFNTPLLCLGKNGTSKKVECLADIYAFGEKHPEFKLISY